MHLIPLLTFRKTVSKHRVTLCAFYDVVDIMSEGGKSCDGDQIVFSMTIKGIYVKC